MLVRFPETAHLLQFFDHQGTAANIVSTVLTYTAPYEIIAAAWDRASHTVRGVWRFCGIVQVSPEAIQTWPRQIRQNYFGGFSSYRPAHSEEIPVEPKLARKSALISYLMRRPTWLTFCSSPHRVGMVGRPAAALRADQHRPVIDALNHRVRPDSVRVCPTNRIAP